ncbi:MAG: M20 family metallopeptidase [Akkermansiaceae bacterium]|nr:M20 family metallopeptidase [Akkermansiaceae bacterium]NNM28306.1 M20 family metallopeptidase [Akkermansiaceae bacterium]
MSDTVTDLLQALVRIPSVNPDGDPGTGAENIGEARIAAFLAPWLDDLGFDVTLEEIQPGRPNLIARAPGPADRPRILLGPHLDTVGVGGMTIDPFAADIVDGRIRGRGTSDTKGPMAAMLWGLRENRAHLATLPVAIDFVAFMAEESGQWGSKQFASTHAADYEFAIVGEPTSLDIVHVTKGSLWATLTAAGKAAHASQPERGENAILHLARALDRLDAELVPELHRFTHPILGSSTLNIGVIRGGTRANIVPDEAAAQVDIRFVPGLAQAGGAAPLLEAFAAAQDPPLALTNLVENPPMEVPPGHPWINRLLNANPSSKLTGAPWFSDAAHLGAAGLPAVCLGPGSIDQAHTADEFIAVADLEAGAAYFSRLVQSFASTPAA